MREIIVTIDETAKTTVETRGFKGKACEDATAELEKAMGIVVSNTRTPEWHTKEVRSAPQ